LLEEPVVSVSFALMLAAVQTAAVAPPPRRATPRVPLHTYVAHDDYPASARQRAEEGTVTFDLAVGPYGRVTHCTIVQSSGSGALDNASCRILRSRARFAPARDRHGNPVDDLGRGTLRWSLAARAPTIASYSPAIMPWTAPATRPGGTVAAEPPRARANLASYVRSGDYPASALARGEHGIVRFRLAVGADGRVADCEVLRSSGSTALDEATCRIMRSRARFTPARNASGHPVAASIESEIGWHLR
jgi:TonB family protein